MKWLEDEIETRGKILDNDVLKVNSFLNHQLDINLLNKMTILWFDHFKKFNPTKILTIEASGIALAALCAQRFNVPAVFAKKGDHSNMGDAYHANVHSFTKNEDTVISVEKAFLTKDDVVLIVDDFLANGSAMRGMIDLCNQAGAKIIGIGDVIEKGYQKGGDKLREEGYDVYSLAVIDSMDPKTNRIVFRKLAR